jgi:hypothetical protein
MGVHMLLIAAADLHARRERRRMPDRYSTQRGQPRGDDLLAIPDVLRAVFDRQDGVLTRRQLNGFGIDEPAIRHSVRARRWRTFGRTVVVLQNSPLTADQRLWVAVLLPDKPAALAGLSAATVAGLRGFEPEEVHILVAHGSDVRLPRWVKLHESRRFCAQDIQQNSTPPRTRPARAVIDGAAWSRYPRRACAILCAAVQQRLTTAIQLADELAAAGSVRHVQIMREILGDIGGGGHTLAEIELGKLACKAGLPAPRRQGLRREDSGKVRWLDAEFDLPDGTVLVVEVDGAAHMQVESWLDDTDRQNEIVIGRQPVLRFPSLVIRLNEQRVVDQLLRMRLAHTS